ncbi:hypothetical protein [Kordiimonas sp. SCSIO 12610]|uniref:hypothetical protein n=1 Tax=Kordiimonas sp. SCSIO 12610 TaxID=2829597 RepID=UPI00210AC10F|nr:hypothetical protein [Kordiimonas sp. SCSIO 12610]UTW56153.1 hypothetical protein KFF44_04455 [Kordiimonas sp. SCSIO 12610]
MAKLKVLGGLMAIYMALLALVYLASTAGGSSLTHGLMGTKIPFQPSVSDQPRVPDSR